MDAKKIILIFILLVFLAGAYMLFAKSKKTTIIDGLAGKDNGDGTVTLTKNNGDTIIVDKPETEEVKAAQMYNLKKTLSSTDKANASGLAKAIYEDMKGWNLHEMRHYKNLYESSDAFFLYFMEDAYPMYDSKSFFDRVKLQDFRQVNPASKKIGLDNGKAVELISFILNRAYEFKI